MGGKWSPAQHAAYKATMAKKRRAEATAKVAAAASAYVKAPSTTADEALGVVLQEYVVEHFGSLPFAELVKQAKARNLTVRLVVELE